MKSEGMSINLLTSSMEHYSGGLSVVPVALAKGLEFDRVILWDVSQNKYHEDNLDAKLLFVALTRPLHQLYVLYEGEMSPILEQCLEGCDEESVAVVR